MFLTCEISKRPLWDIYSSGRVVISAVAFIVVVIVVIDLLPKRKRTDCKRQNVNHGKQKINKLLKRRIDIMRSSFDRMRLVRCYCCWKNKKKGDEEAKKKQGKGLRDKGDS
jgi:hypothetical protein